MTETSAPQRFRALHERPGILVVPNPVNVGTARLLEHLGAEALATTSAGFAHSIGRPDAVHAVGREEALAHTHAIVTATQLPVNADLERGFGDDPEAVEMTVRGAVEVGAAGGSIEDATGDSTSPIYPLDLATDRIAAATDAAAESGFVLTARAENFLYGRPDLADTIARLQAFQEAGADVLYAPGLPDLEAVRAVVAATDRPISVLAWPAYTVTDLANTGVKRVTLGSWLARAAMNAFGAAAIEMLERGTMDFADEAAPFESLNDIYASGRGS